MSKRYVSSSARMLYQVFIQPSQPSTRTLRTPTAAVATFPKPSTTPFLIHRRTYAWRKAKAEPEKAHYIVDEKIGSRLINLIGHDGTFHREQRLDVVLRGMDRVTHNLVMLQPGSNAELPTCKILTKGEVREMELDKRGEKTKKQVDDLSKTIELNWTVGDHDLEHWMNRLVRFLEEGRRVEIGFGPKKRARKAEIEECENLVAKVKETLGSVNAVEWAAPEGRLGGIYTLFVDPSHEVKERLKALKKEARHGGEEKKLQKQLAKEAEREKQRAKQERARAARERKGIKIDEVEIKTGAQDSETLATSASDTNASENETSATATPKVSRWKLKEEKRRLEEEARLLAQEEFPAEQQKRQPSFNQERFQWQGNRSRQFGSNGTRFGSNATRW